MSAGMGHITSILEAESELTVVAVVGDVDAEQVLSQIISFLTGEPTQLVLWDFREGSMASLSSIDLQMIVKRGAEFADRRKGGRTAIVCSKDLDYGLGRMFQTFASLQHIPFEIQVFRSQEEAREWLNRSRKG
jgi:hypothetical protein